MPDWWSVGIVIYQLLCGKAPHDFEGMNDDGNEEKYKKKICNDKIEFKGNYTADMKSLITGLLTIDPTKRLGAKGGWKQIMEHKVFKSRG
jgi:serum/glucocorticoid-regulated kinase 2